MKITRAVIAFLMLALAGGYSFAAGPVAWNSRDYQSEFKLFTEVKAFDRAAWEALPPAQQEAELQRAKEPAARRLASLTAWYEAAMRPWNTQALKGYTAAIKEKDLQAAELWLGRDAARELAKKMAAVRAALKKAPAEGLNAADEKALAPYLTPEAIADLRAMRVAAGSAADAKKKGAAPVAASGEKLQKLSSSLPAGDPAALNKFFDGSTSRGGTTSGDSAALSSPSAVTAVTSNGSTPYGTPRTMPKKRFSIPPPPAQQLTEDFKHMRGYADINRDNQFRSVMKEVDKDGESSAAKGEKMKSAGYATLRSIFAVSKDFDETFINNPSPKDEDVRKVIDRIRSAAKTPDDAWQIAYQMRAKRDFPALRDAEHYLWACSEASESRWKAARTVISTPLYSAAKLPGLRAVFFDDTTSPPSVSEMKWGLKGVKECVK
jgi:hypothetical protein